MLNSTKRFDKIFEPFSKTRCPTIDEQDFTPKYYPKRSWFTYYNILDFDILWKVMPILSTIAYILKSLC